MPNSINSAGNISQSFHTSMDESLQNNTGSLNNARVHNTNLQPSKPNLQSIKHDLDSKNLPPAKRFAAEQSVAGQSEPMDVGNPPQNQTTVTPPNTELEAMRSDREFLAKLQAAAQEASDTPISKNAVTSYLHSLPIDKLSNIFNNLYSQNKSTTDEIANEIVVYAKMRKEEKAAKAIEKNNNSNALNRTTKSSKNDSIGTFIPEISKKPHLTDDEIKSAIKIIAELDPQNQLSAIRMLTNNIKDNFSKSHKDVLTDVLKKIDTQSKLYQKIKDQIDNYQHQPIEEILASMGSITLK